MNSATNLEYLDVSLRLTVATLKSSYFNYNNIIYKKCFIIKFKYNNYYCLNIFFNNNNLLLTKFNDI